MNVQYINDKNGETQFVILPIEEYRRLTGDDNDDEWEEVPYEASEFDDVSLPFAIADIMTGRDVSAIAAWRIHRGLTQAQAAEKAGISQAALSQIEKKGARPQSKTREQFAAIYGCLPEQLVL
ncbi:TPA: helix-turn-helix transcriptional regulator [Neisseria bacilliformis]|uniref:helix-turn-helix domain-containing protein n=1 Tax=Neisseria bacilliformis TaxID=267212 RepID=UPI0009E1FCC7|nr:helix-turn-helix transcriptional regulator [Neisseria bacilliformis]